MPVWAAAAAAAAVAAAAGVTPAADRAVAAGAGAAVVWRRRRNVQRRRVRVRETCGGGSGPAGHHTDTHTHGQRGRPAAEGAGPAGHHTDTHTHGQREDGRRPIHRRRHPIHIRCAHSQTRRQQWGRWEYRDGRTEANTTGRHRTGHWPSDGHGHMDIWTASDTGTPEWKRQCDKIDASA